MQVRLEKINPFERQRRFYDLSTGRTLFGEWCITRKWGCLVPFPDGEQSRHVVVRLGRAGTAD